MTRLFREWWEHRLLDRCLTSEQRDQLLTYILLLEKWNQQINLTGSTLQANTEAALDRLILEPIEFQQRVQIGAVRVLDIGSGSGSPALPFLISCPQADLTLVEARQKKAVFLREASRAIGLQPRVECCRFEELADKKPGGFEVAMTRAVRVDDALLTRINQALSVNGTFYYFTSSTSRTPQITPTRFPSTTVEFQTPTGFQIQAFKRA